MIVKELIDALSRYPESLEVEVEYIDSEGFERYPDVDSVKDSDSPLYVCLVAR